MSGQEGIPDLMGRYMAKAVGCIHRTHDREFRDLGLGRGQFGLMMALYRGDGVVQGSLCEYGDKDKTTVTRGLRRLIENGYVERVKDPDDARSYRIILTDRGWGVKDIIVGTQTGIEDLLLDGFDECEREDLMSYLRRIGENVDRIREGSY